MTGLRWLRATLAPEAPVEPLVRLRAEVGLAQLAFIAGDYLASFAAIESAVPAARQVGDDVVLARCLATAGYVWWFLDPDRSAALFEESLEAARRSGDDWTRSTGLAGLGWARYFAGRFDAATEPLREGIELTARSGRRKQGAMAVLGCAAIELWLGQLAAAEASARQALGMLRAIGDATWSSAALAVLAEIERTRGQLETAGHHAAEAIEVAARANSAINVMLATGHLGRILLARGEPGAAGYLDQAVQLARAFAVRPMLAWWLDSLGELAELDGRYGDARSWYEQAVGHAAECGLAVDACRARHHLGRLAWLTGDRASAVNGCHEALAGQLEAGDHLGLVETLETLGGLLVDDGRARRGLPLLAAAATARARLGFPVRPVEAGRIAGWVASGREHLGEQAEPAWQRGAGLGLAEAAAMARRGRGPRRRPAFGWSSLTPFDNRGCGRSQAPPAPYLVADMAANQPHGKTQAHQGRGRGSQQRQPPPGASVINEQATEGLQRLYQSQVVPGFYELPGQCLVAAVDRRCPVAGKPGQPGPGDGGRRRRPPPGRTQPRGRRPVRTSFARRRNGRPARPARPASRATRRASAARRRHARVATASSRSPGRPGFPQGEQDPGPGARWRASR